VIGLTVRGPPGCGGAAAASGRFFDWIRRVWGADEGRINPA